MERSIERSFIKGIERLGGKAYKLASPGSVGMPDRLVCFKGGVICFVELKDINGRLSEIQKYRLEELNNLGFKTYVLYGLVEVKEFLSNLKEGINGI